MTDPTITIAGLEARIKCLVAALRSANTGRAEAATLDSAACGYNAQLRTERDALAAQLAEVRAKLDAAPKVCAIHSYEHGPGPCMTCGAWPPGTRELIAACRTRIAGLEQAADERSAEVARLTAERTEWIAAAVAIGERVDHLGPVASGGGDIAPREWIHYAQDLAGRVKARIAGDGRPCNGSCDIALASRQVGPDGIVPRNARECAELWEREAARLWREEKRLTARVAELEALAPSHPVYLPLPAQDQAEELIAAYCDEFAARYEAEGNPPHMDRWHEVSEKRRQFAIRTMATTLAKLGAAPITPTAAPVDRAAAERVVRAYHDSVRSPTCPASELGTGEWNRAVDAMSDALASLGASPTSPTVAPQPAEVFAGVSIDELCSVYSAAYGERPGHRDDRRPDAIRAVLARLEVSLVAPVDPEAVARAYHDHKDAPAPEWDEVDAWRGRDSDEQHLATAAMRATLTARGIPVTPEVGK